MANYSFFEQSHSHRKGFIYYVSSHIKNISMTTWQMGVSCKGGGGLFKKNTDQQIPYAHLYSVLSIPSYFTWWTLWIIWWLSEKKYYNRKWKGKFCFTITLHFKPMFFPINIKYSCNSIIAYYKTIKDVHVSLVTIEFGDPHTSFSLPLQPKKIAWNSPKANKIYGPFIKQA